MAVYRNSIKSKKAIRKAFAELVYEKGDINKITVKEIIERADISKSTFYAHYVDIYAVIEEFGNEVINTINQTIDDYMKVIDDEFMPYIKRLVSLFKENEELYRKLFKVENEVNFIDKIKSIILNKLEGYILNQLKDIDSKKIRFYLDFLTNGMTYLLIDYFKGNIDTTLDEIAEEANNMLKAIVLFLRSEQIKK